MVKIKNKNSEVLQKLEYDEVSAPTAEVETLIQKTLSRLEKLLGIDSNGKKV